MAETTIEYRPCGCPPWVIQCSHIGEEVLGILDADWSHKLESLQVRAPNISRYCVHIRYADGEIGCVGMGDSNDLDEAKRAFVEVLASKQQSRN